MNQLIIIVKEKGQLIFYTNLEEAFCSGKTPLMVYLEGKFSLREILSLIDIPLIYSKLENIFDFSDAKNLFEEDLPSNFALLVKRIGYANTLEVLLGNNLYNTKDLCRLGLINQAYTKEEFNGQVERVSKLSLSAIDLVLDLVKRMPHLANAQAEVLERYAFALRFTHLNIKEGLEAFLEKRPPKFS